MELCDYLTGKVLEPMFAREGKEWDHRFMDFFTFDNGCDPLEPTGTIRFTVPPMFAGQTCELEWAILQELCRLGIKTAPFVYEKDPVLGTIKAIVIHVTENPTALMAPPEVNMSQTRGCLVLRDLLGYQRVNGRYEFAAEDLVEPRLGCDGGQDRHLHGQPGEGGGGSAPNSECDQHEGHSALPGRAEAVRPLGQEPQLPETGGGLALSCQLPERAQVLALRMG